MSPNCHICDNGYRYFFHDVVFKSHPHLSGSRNVSSYVCSCKICGKKVCQELPPQQLPLADMNGYIEEIMSGQKSGKGFQL